MFTGSHFWNIDQMSIGHGYVHYICLGCNNSAIPQLQRRFGNTTIAVTEWMCDYILMKPLDNLPALTWPSRMTTPEASTKRTTHGWSGVQHQLFYLKDIYGTQIYKFRDSFSSIQFWYQHLQTETHIYQKDKKDTYRNVASPWPPPPPPPPPHCWRNVFMEYRSKTLKSSSTHCKQQNSFNSVSQLNISNLINEDS